MTLQNVEYAQDKDRYNFYGPAWELIVWGFEAIGGVSVIAGVLCDEDLHLKCLRWDFVRQVKHTTNEQFYEMLDDAILAVDNISPNGFKYDFEYYLSSLRPNAMDVFFIRQTQLTHPPTRHGCIISRAIIRQWCQQDFPPKWHPWWPMYTPEVVRLTLLMHQDRIPKGARKEEWWCLRMLPNTTGLRPASLVTNTTLGNASGRHLLVVAEVTVVLHLLAPSPHPYVFFLLVYR